MDFELFRSAKWIYYSYTMRKITRGGRFRGKLKEIIIRMTKKKPWRKNLGHLLLYMENHRESG